MLCTVVWACLQFFKLYNRSPSDEERRRNTRVRPKFVHHILSLPDDAEVFYEYLKQRKTLTPDQLRQLKVLVQNLRPEESDDEVITRILRLFGYADRDIARPGRLRFGIRQTVSLPGRLWHLETHTISTGWTQEMVLTENG